MYRILKECRPRLDAPSDGPSHSHLFNHYHHDYPSSASCRRPRTSNGLGCFERASLRPVHRWLLSDILGHLLWFLLRTFSGPLRDMPELNRLNIDRQLWRGICLLLRDRLHQHLTRHQCNRGTRAYTARVYCVSVHRRLEHRRDLRRTRRSGHVPVGGGRRLQIGHLRLRLFLRALRVRAALSLRHHPHGDHG